MEASIVVGGAELDEVRALFREYADWLAVDLSFQGFEEELAALPGAYRAPQGTLLLCRADGRAAGCIGVRPWEDGACEVKRLYARPEFRGRGCGRFLIQQAIAWAQRAGYQRMLLDTLPRMAPAQRLYEGFGFREVAPYRFNPIAGTRFMELSLA